MLNFYEGTIGTSYQGTTIDLDRINVEDRGPTVAEIRTAAAGVGIQLPMSGAEIARATSGRAMSLPNDTIYLPPLRPGGSPKDQIAQDALIVHEGFHQYQYQAEGGAKVFGSLLQEQQIFLLSVQSQPTKDKLSLSGNPITDYQNALTAQGSFRHPVKLI